jgi:hypothetical protein
MFVTYSLRAAHRAVATAAYRAVATATDSAPAARWGTEKHGRKEPNKYSFIPSSVESFGCVGKLAISVLSKLGSTGKGQEVQLRGGCHS